MNIGFPILPYQNSPITTLFKFAKALNVSCVEFESRCFLENYSETDFLQIIKSGIPKANSIHAPFYGHHQFDVSSPELPIFDQFCQNLQLWKKSLHLEKIVIHLPQDPHSSTDKFIDRVVQLTELGLLPCLENLPEYSWEDFTYFYDLLTENCSQVGVCYDFGHDVLRHQQAAMDGIPTWVLDILKSPIGHLHLSGFSYTEDLHAPFSVVPEFEQDILPKIIAFFKKHQLHQTEATLILESAPKAIDQIGSLLDTYLTAWKLVGGWPYWSRVFRLFIVRPIILRRVKKLYNVNKLK